MVTYAKENEIKLSALELIGNTPIVALDRLYTGPGRILAKCEFMNPGGSIKCRTSYSMIDKARKSGQLQPGTPVVEVTSGNQGTGLAVVCAVLGHPLLISMSEGNSAQRAIHMEALGAKCEKVPLVEGIPGSVTFADLKAVEEHGLKRVAEKKAFYVDQFNNQNNSLAHYETTGPEIWRQTGGHVNAFVSTVGTAGTFVGTSKYLKQQNSEIKTYVVEPAGAEAIKGEAIRKPRHLLQGSGYGFVPNLFEYEFMNGTLSVTDEETLEYMKLIGEKEGLYVGYTSAANVAAAVKLLESGLVANDAWVVTILTDTGLKYIPLSQKNVCN